MVLALVLAACGGGEDGESLPAAVIETPGVMDTTAAAPALSPVITSPTVAETTSQAVEPPAADGDPADFREFADLIARAVAEGDTAFFASRVQAEPYTCSEIEVTQGGLGGAEPGLCQEAGQQLALVLQCFWRSECVHTLPERLVAEMDDYFGLALPAAADDFGTGGIRLYATAVPSLGLYGGRTLHTAVLTAIIPLPGRPDGGPVRTARGVDFEYVEGRWLIRGTLSAGFLEGGMFEAFLAPDSGPYREVELF